MSFKIVFLDKKPLQELSYSTKSMGEIKYGSCKIDHVCSLRLRKLGLAKNLRSLEGSCPLHDLSEEHTLEPSPDSVYPSLQV